MSISLHCGRCGKKFSAARAMAGRQAPCPRCKAAVNVTGKSALAGAAGNAAGTRRPAEEDLFAGLLPSNDSDDIYAAEIVPAPAQTRSLFADTDDDGYRLAPLEKPARATPAPQQPKARKSRSLVVAGVIGLLVFGGGGFAVYKSIDALRHALPWGPAIDAQSVLPFDTASAPWPHFPPRPPFRTLAPGVEFAQTRLLTGAGPGRANQLYLYLPSGHHRPRSLGCVFLAPAGATCFSGMGLGEGDQPEHLPYVQAGFAVVAYEVDGELSGGDYPSNAQMAQAFRDYQASMAGLVNARNALEYALSHLPEVDPSRLYTAGHSSAGRQALLFAEHEPRIRAVVAYNAVTDVVEDMRSFLWQGELIMPGLRSFLTRSSPLTHVSRLQCAVRIFHSEGDERIPVSQARQFFAALPPQAQPRELHIVPGGDHYNPMIHQGIPAATLWLREIDRARGGSASGPVRPAPVEMAANDHLPPTPEPSPSVVLPPLGPPGFPPGTPDNGAAPWSDPLSPFAPPGFAPPTSSSTSAPSPAPSPPGAPRLPSQINGRIRALAISGAGELAAYGDMGGRVRVWETATKREIAFLRVFERGWVNQLAITDKGLVAVSGGFPPVTELWDARLQQRIAQIDARSAADGLAFSPDGSQLATGAYRNVRLLSADHGQEIRRWERDGYPQAFTFSNDGAHLAVGWRDGVTQVWRLASPESPLFEVKTHNIYVSGLAFSSDARRLLITARDGKLAYWDLWSVAAIWEQQTTPNDRVCILPGDQEALAMRNGRAEVWRLDTGERVREIRPDPRAQDLVVARDGRLGVFSRFGGSSLGDIDHWAP